MKNGENYKDSRRNFFKTIATALLVVPVVKACQEKMVSLLIRLSGTNHVLGHRLHTKDFPLVSKKIEIPYLIVGGGVSGLSAARQLTKKGITNFLLLELESQLGGNSRNGENKYSKYPLGAHYLPLPNWEDKELLQFLEEEKILLGYDHNGLAIFDETQLSLAPEERLFIRNNWQESVVPKLGNSEMEDLEFNRFFDLMYDFRVKKDNQGKYWFTIPLQDASLNREVQELDQLTMKQWLEKNQFVTAPLLNYIDYCCRDDFGLGIEFVSAYAGIHYFAARKQNATSGKLDSVLTWPEGNARLVQHLKKYTKDKSLTQHLVYDITLNRETAVVKAYDEKAKIALEITAQKIIMATPQYVNQYLLNNRSNFTQNFDYAPWLLATLTVHDLTDNFSFPLSWDNVIYGAKGLGYIYDQHQSLQQTHEKKVITYYTCFSTPNSKKARRAIYKKNKEYWKKAVFDDLKIAHPNIEEVTESIEIHLIGHGMISPRPGFLFGQSKIEASKPIHDTLFFAHTDLSGISIFEEAFHQGINAVNRMLHETTVDSQV